MSTHDDVNQGAADAESAAQSPDPAKMLAAGLPSDAPASDVGDTVPIIEVPSLEEMAEELAKYEMLALIGKGGMGVVYKARQRELDRVVAVKVVSRRVAGNPHFMERFRREAQAMAKLSHPNIVAVHEFGQTATGRPFIVMELIEGSNLRDVLRAGRMKPAEALKIIPPICEALQFAHDEGIVHRDIKPENILLDRKGRVKIADFGLAKLLGAASPAHGLTDSNMVMGTPHYMAPEQFERPLEVDHRADVYALGVMMYEMLTGELPLGRFAPPSKKVEVDVRLDEVVLRALEREPQHRYQHVSELQSGIADAATPPMQHGSYYEKGAPAAAAPAPPPAPPIVAGSFSRWVVAGLINQGIAVILAVVLVPLVTAFSWMNMGLSWTILACPLIPGLFGAFFNFKGLAEIRRSGGRIRGATVGAVGVVIFPALMMWGVFAMIARYFIAILDSLLQNDSLGTALRNPHLSTADRYGIVYAVGSLILACAVSYFAVQSLRRYATPWIAWPPAQRRWVGVLLVAAMLMCVAIAFSSTTNTDGFRRAGSGEFVSTLFRVGAFDPWLSMAEHANDSTYSHRWKMNLLSVSGLFLMFAVICDLLHAWFQRKKENGASCVRTGRMLAIGLIGVMSIAALVNFMAVAPGSRWHAMINPRQIPMSTGNAVSNAATSGPTQYPFEFVLTPVGGESVVLADMVTRPGAKGQTPGWESTFDRTYKTIKGENILHIGYEGYTTDESGPIDLWNVDCSYNPNGIAGQEVKMQQDVRYKGKELVIFDDDRSRLVIRPKATWPPSYRVIAARFDSEAGAEDFMRRLVDNTGALLKIEPLVDGTFEVRNGTDTNLKSKADRLASELRPFAPDVHVVELKDTSNHQ